jgi:hypothetical protein
MSQPAKGIVFIAFVGGDYNVILSEPHEIITSTKNAVCIGNSCKCTVSCALGVRIEKEFEHTFEIDYKIL